jgi:hypothetical protein
MSMCEQAYCQEICQIWNTGILITLNMEYHNLDGVEYGILDVKHSMFRGQTFCDFGPRLRTRLCEDQVQDRPLFGLTKITYSKKRANCRLPDIFEKLADPVEL